MCFIIKTLLLCVLTSGIRLVSSQSDSSTNEGHNIFCQFTGQGWCNPKNTYLFNIDDLQNALGRCQNIIYPTYYFDRRNEISSQVIEFDKNALRALAECGKTVYFGLSFMSYDKWSEVLCPEDNDKLFNLHVTTLISYIKRYSISGVIIQDFDVFDPLKPYETKQITAFVNTLKSKMESLKVGLYVIGVEYDLYSKSEYFDFDEANGVIDFFFFDMTVLNDCTPNTKLDGLNPITSDKSDMVTMEQISNAVMNCKVDKCKAYALLLIGPLESVESKIANDDADRYGTFSDLCKSAKNGNDTSRYCFDSTTTLYNQGKFVREHFAGLMMSTMESDDYDCSCECRKFVATNAILDGWECCDLQACATTDNLLT